VARPLEGEEEGEALGSLRSSSGHCRHLCKKEKAPPAQGGTDGGAIDEHKATQDDTCVNCSKTGHWAKDCQQVKRGG
jgi:hypothetical protein